MEKLLPTNSRLHLVNSTQCISQLNVPLPDPLIGVLVSEEWDKNDTSCLLSLTLITFLGTA